MQHFARNFIIIAALGGLSGAIVVLSLAYRWTKAPVLKSFSLILLSVSFIITSPVFPSGIMVGNVRARDILDVAGNLLFLAVLPAFASEARGDRLPRFLRAAYYAIGAIAWGLYARACFLGSPPPLAYVAIAFVLTITLVVWLYRKLERVKDGYQQRLFRRYLKLTSFFAPFVVIDTFLTDAGNSFVAKFHFLPGGLYVIALSAAIIGEARGWLLHVAEGKIRETREQAQKEASAEEAEVVSVTGESPEFAQFGFSPRQAEITELVLQGYSAKEIGARLGISAKTAENHTYALYRKVGARSRLQFYEIVRQGK